MKEHHIIARPRGNGSVLMQHVFRDPQLSAAVHRVALPVNSSLMAVIWWPERMQAQLETAQNQLCVKQLQDQLRKLQ